MIVASVVFLLLDTTDGGAAIKHEEAKIILDAATRKMAEVQAIVEKQKRILRNTSRNPLEPHVKVEPQLGNSKSTRSEKVVINLLDDDEDDTTVTAAAATGDTSKCVCVCV